MSEDLLNLSNRQKMVLAAALGAGVLVGAGGLIVYQGLNQVSASFLGPDTERIDLWFEAFFVTELRRVIEWLQEIKTADQWGPTLLWISSKTEKKIWTHWKLIINDAEIIACNLKLFKNPVNDFINQEISAERER